MRAILMFDNCEGQSHKTVSTDHTEHGPIYIGPMVQSITRQALAYLTLFSFTKLYVLSTSTNTFWIQSVRQFYECTAQHYD